MNQNKIAMTSLMFKVSIISQMMQKVALWRAVKEYTTKLVIKKQLMPLSMTTLMQQFKKLYKKILEQQLQERRIGDTLSGNNCKKQLRLI